MSQNENGQKNIENETAPPTQNGGNGKILAAAQVTQFSGPMPPPHLIAGYGEIDPSFPERLFGLTEREAIHRQKMEEKALDADIEDMRAERRYQIRGQTFGFSIGVIATFVGGIAALLGAPLAGGFIGCAGVTGLVSVFITGKHYEAKQIKNTEETAPQKISEQF